MGWFSEIRNGVSRIYTSAELYFVRGIDTLTQVSLIGSLRDSSHRDDREVDVKQRGCCPASHPHSAM